MNYLLLFASLLVVCFGRRVVLRTMDVTSVDVIFNGNKGPLQDLIRIRITDVPSLSFDTMLCPVSDNAGLQDDLKALRNACPEYTWSAQISKPHDSKLTKQHIGTLIFGKRYFHSA
eukprot:Platyproteum_vivax@DN1112_c0_g1_i1.p1